MNRKLLELALERLRSSDWEYFEELSSAFLASDFPGLRTMANPSGDGGRDSELFSPGGIATVAVQYSVSESWDSKISSTVKRLRETCPGITVLVYMTNQAVGAKADKKRAELLTQGIVLDLRDKSWFLERYEIDDAKYGAASRLVELIATPYLEGNEVIQTKRPSLNNQEAKAALVYLGLQWEDETTQKGLTKVAYEALARSALRGTDSNNRISRAEIYRKISSFIPTWDEKEAKKYIDSALDRLTKRYIRHWEKEDEYCLTHEESLRLRERLVEQESEESEYDAVVAGYFEIAVSDYDSLNPNDIPSLIVRAKRIIDRFLFQSGEAFASSVVSGSVNKLDVNSLKNVIIDDVNKHSADKRIAACVVDVMIDCVSHIVSSPSDVVRKHLRMLSDSYTLFAFLREVPDVQSATKKIFSYGNIWLDTTIILPVLAESLKESGENRRFTNILKALRQSGVSLFVTSGVITEVISHIRVSVTCAGYDINAWRGRVPYLYYQYVELGYSPSNFRGWVELYRGYERPEDDVADYLSQEFGIQKKDLDTEAQSVDSHLKYSVERLWAEAHEKRRSNHADEEKDETITANLVRHDVESYLGIVALRQKEEGSELGFKNWWLTIDHIAWEIRDKVKGEFAAKTPPSPLISLDFLAHDLSFGPSRSHFQRTEESMLPVALDYDFSEIMPREIVAIAENVRNENAGMPDVVIRRKVRDACDRARRRCGALTRQAINSEQRDQADAR